MSQKQGFYREKALIEKEKGEGFSFLDNIFVIDPMNGNRCKGGTGTIFGRYDVTMYDYLHGFCDIFALRLHNEYGYDVVSVSNENGEMIHSYCADDRRGEYVDIRGRTSDPREFFAEFKDWIDANDLRSCKFKQVVPVLGSHERNRLYAYTQFIVRKYASYYS